MNLQYGDEFPEDTEQLEDEELDEWDGFRSEDLADAVFEMLEADDPNDLDWFPEQRKMQREKRKKNQKGQYTPIQSHFIRILSSVTMRPKAYQKGPDVMSKCSRTQQCYAVAFGGQGKLTGFGFKSPSYSPRVHGTKLKGKSLLSPVIEPDQQPTV